VVPLAAGSASDTTARAVADQIGRQFNRTFVIENRTGAGGYDRRCQCREVRARWLYAARLWALATANALYPRLPYDTLNDFIPVMALGQQAQVIVGAPSKGYKKLGDLIAPARPGPEL